jgi:hypothetical protein
MNYMSHINMYESQVLGEKVNQRIIHYCVSMCTKFKAKKN